MPAVTYNLTVEAGAAFAVDFEWHDTTATGPLIDTTGYTAHMQIRDRRGGTVLATYTAGSGLTVTAGVVSLRLGADQTTALLPAWVGVYDLELHSADPADVVRLVQGKVSISPDVTSEVAP